MKKIIFIITFSINLFIEKCFGNTIKDNILPKGESIIQVNNVGEGSSGLDIFSNFLVYIKDSMFGILVTIGMFVFLLIGAKLFMARGKPDEFKKAIMWLVYAIIGFAIIPMAWGVIKMISTLTI